MKRICTIAIFSLAVSGCAGMMDTLTQVATGIDVRVPSNPDTVVWGHLPAQRSPVARIRSGQAVQIDTVSHQGMINGTDPVQFFAQVGVAAKEDRKSTRLNSSH